jgi:hypothetical protein
MVFCPEEFQVVPSVGDLIRTVPRVASKHREDKLYHRLQEQRDITAGNASI